MVKNIVKDIDFLSEKSIDMTKSDKDIIKDLKDTLSFNSLRCVGMAANMIGYHKNCIIFYDNQKQVIMINPKIISKDILYETKEGCLSLSGERITKRYQIIKVEYLDESFKRKVVTYTGFVAQIIQHEIDHLFGIII